MINDRRTAALIVTRRAIVRDLRPLLETNQPPLDIRVKQET